MVFKIDEVLLFFAAYAIMGWISEVIFAALKTGRFVNRGFLNGPLCPIYGFGVVAVVLALEPVKDSLILLFLGSFVLTTALEFLTGLILEKVFHDHWWDYSKEPFNIKGYVCLRFSIMWGIACVMVVKVLHPLVQGGIDALPVWLRWTIIGVFYVYLFADLAVTVTDIQKFNRGMGKMAEQLHDISDFAGEHIAGAAIELGTKGEILRTELETKKSEYHPLYPLEMALKDKITTIAKEIYGAGEVIIEPAAKQQIARIESLGFGSMPVCMAKNQYSLSDDKTILGRPEGFPIHIRDVYVSAGAGFVVAITGTIMTMPGLPKVPAAEGIDVNDDGQITGLF